MIPISKSKLIDEIIVVDDGSDDNTFKVVRKFNPKVKYIRNQINKGKGFSMNKGVKNTNAEILFFCDSDLKNLTPEIIDKIIWPVLKKETEMSIGLRNNFLNRIAYKIKFTSLSGQRALTKNLWKRLPKFYKNKFRTEIGLNFYAKNYIYQIFDYQQILKEKKYKFLVSFKRRMGMNFDIVLAWLKLYLING